LKLLAFPRCVKYSGDAELFQRSTQLDRQISS
jgi:hypothetical protein